MPQDDHSNDADDAAGSERLPAPGADRIDRPSTIDVGSRLPAPGADSASYLDKLNHYLTFTLSLPERTARAASSLVGGSTMLLTRTLVPGAVKQSTSYRFTLGMFQTFLIRNVAGVDRVAHEMELKDRFVHRKLMGTSLEAAGLLTIHLSPVWVFAIASDAARGGQVFLQRLAGYLQENGVISKDTNPETLEQILLSIHDMGRQGATAVDTPPLSMAEVRELAKELRGTSSALAANSANLLPDLESLWDQISVVASKENLKIEQLLGILSVSAASIVQTGAGTADAVGRTGYTLVDEVLLEHYRCTLDDINERGALRYMTEHMRPFLDNARSHFDFQRETWTQRTLKNLLGRLRSRFRAGR